mmetsp:Transcript_46397/g.116049  ORF Transcript_46397/g.116049 Transcript_46397/m.116049 type:complete len:218 (-) Transcript_46397:784-1437(-)
MGSRALYAPLHATAAAPHLQQTRYSATEACRGIRCLCICAYCPLGWLSPVPFDGQRPPVQHIADGVLVQFKLYLTRRDRDPGSPGRHKVLGKLGARLVVGPECGSIAAGDDEQHSGGQDGVGLVPARALRDGGKLLHVLDGPRAHHLGGLLVLRIQQLLLRAPGEDCSPPVRGPPPNVDAPPLCLCPAQVWGGLRSIVRVHNTFHLHSHGRPIRKLQ